MSMFGQMKDLYKLQRQAKKIQRELKNLEIEATAAGGEIKIIMSGEQKILELSIAESLLSPEKRTSLEKGLKTAINEAVKQAQKLAAERSKKMMGDMGLNVPGLK